MKVWTHYYNFWHIYVCNFSHCFAIVSHGSLFFGFLTFVNNFYKYSSCFLELICEILWGLTWSCVLLKRRLVLISSRNLGQCKPRTTEDVFCVVWVMAVAMNSEASFLLLFLAQGWIHHFSFQTHGRRSVEFRYNSLNWEYVLWVPILGALILSFLHRKGPGFCLMSLKAINTCENQSLSALMPSKHVPSSTFVFRLQRPTLPWQIIETLKNFLLIFLQHV